MKIHQRRFGCRVVVVGGGWGVEADLGARDLERRQAEITAADAWGARKRSKGQRI